MCLVGFAHSFSIRMFPTQRGHTTNFNAETLKYAPPQGRLQENRQTGTCIFMQNMLN